MNFLADIQTTNVRRMQSTWPFSTGESTAGSSTLWLVCCWASCATVKTYPWRWGPVSTHCWVKRFLAGSVIAWTFCPLCARCLACARVWVWGSFNSMQVSSESTAILKSQRPIRSSRFGVSLHWQRHPSSAASRLASGDSARFALESVSWLATYFTLLSLHPRWCQLVVWNNIQFWELTGGSYCDRNRISLTFSSNEATSKPRSSLFDGTRFQRCGLKSVKIQHWWKYF